MDLHANCRERNEDLFFSRLLLQNVVPIYLRRTTTTITITTLSANNTMRLFLGASSALVMCVCGADALAEWTPTQQVRLENPTSVAVSADGSLAAFTVSTVSTTAGAGKFAGTGWLTVSQLHPNATTTTMAGAGSSWNVTACNDGGCSAPTFSADGSLGFVHNGDLYRLR